MNIRYGLTGAEWNLIEDLFPATAPTGRPPTDPRTMLNAMVWLIDTCAKWRDIPSDLGACQTVYKYFDRWNFDCTLQEIANRLTQFAIDNGELDGDLWCIDRMHIKSTPPRRWVAKKRILTNQLIMLWAYQNADLR